VDSTLRRSHQDCILRRRVASGGAGFRRFKDLPRIFEELVHTLLSRVRLQIRAKPASPVSFVAFCPTKLVFSPGSLYTEVSPGSSVFKLLVTV
jgi:hypothetical protein